MKKGLFDTPLKASQGSVESNEDHAYKALAGTSIAAALAFLSPLAFIDWWLLAVPAVGFCLGLVALRDIIKRPDIFTGKRLAKTATTFSLVYMGGTIYLSWVYAAELPDSREFITVFCNLLRAHPRLQYLIPLALIDGHNVLIKGYMYPGKNNLGFVNFYLYEIKEIAALEVIQELLIVFLSIFKMKRACHLLSSEKIADTFTVRPTFGQDGIEGGSFTILKKRFLAKVFVCFYLLHFFQAVAETKTPL